MKVIVAVASRHGSTRAIAEAIATTLSARGHDATVADVRDLRSLGDADAVVLGSAVYRGRWLHAARTFARRFERDLVVRDVWLFSSGLTESATARPGLPPTDSARTAAAIGAVEQTVFLGNLDIEALGPLERALIRSMHVPGGDRRDWDAVEAFAQRVADGLVGTRSPSTRIGAANRA